MQSYRPAIYLTPFNLQWLLLGVFLGITSPGCLNAQETINGALEPGDIEHPQRFFREGNPSTTFPGLFGSGGYYYDIYRFHNPLSTAAAAEVVISGAGSNIYHAAYLQDFDYNDPAANFLYAFGSSQDPTTLVFDVPGRSEIIVLVQSSNPLGTATYEVKINAPFRLGPLVLTPELSVNKLRPFPRTLVGKSSRAQTLTFTNTGEGPLTDLSVKRSGKHPREFRFTRLPTSTLAPNASATVKVIFDPRSPGRRRAVLQVTSNTDLVEIPVNGYALKGPPSQGPRFPPQ